MYKLIQNVLRKVFFYDFRNQQFKQLPASALEPSKNKLYNPIFTFISTLLSSFTNFVIDYSFSFLNLQFVNRSLNQCQLILLTFKFYLDLLFHISIYFKSYFKLSTKSTSILNLFILF